jgi:hypothetical protein
VRQRFAAGVERFAHVRNFPRATGGLSLAKALTCRNQSVECLAMLPVELVHSPRRNRRLYQRLHTIRLVATSALLQLGGKRVARGGEVCHRESEQSVKIILKLALRTIFRHSSSFSPFSQKSEKKPDQNTDVV